MKRRFEVLILVMALACASAVAGRRVEMGSMDYALAARDGATARFTFKIVDEVGNVVTGANVQVSFARHDSQWIKGVTDENGLYTVEGWCSGKLLYDVDKVGCYKTASEYCFGEGKVMLEDGKWFPWNATNTVILKRVKSPVVMYVSAKDLLVPLRGTNVAFDVERGDWVDPYGKGRCGDLIVKCDDKFTDPWTGFRKLELTFGTNAIDGVQRHKLDGFSDFRSVYEAPLTGYEKTITWSLEMSRKDKDIVNEPPRDEYFVFRVRTEMDAEGKILKANYGKIYGPVQYGNLGGRLLLRMIYYFNPDPNSRSLEFDTTKNLSGQRIPCP